MEPGDRPPDSHVTVGEDDGRRALIVGGYVQSVAVGAAEFGDGYWPAMVPDVRPERALILGLGGGTIVQLIVRRFGPMPIVGVDCDREVVDAARRELGLDMPNLTVVEADAFQFVAGCRDQFDYVCVDLYQGGQLVHGSFGKTFLRQVSGLLSPRGIAVFNLFLGRRLPQHLSRLTRQFHVIRTFDVEMNLVVHCRRK